MSRRKYILTPKEVKTRKGEVVTAYTAYRLLRRGPISLVAMRLHGPYTSKAGRDYYVLFLRLKYKKRSRYGR